jgi:hypothetical protein
MYEGNGISDFVAQLTYVCRLAGTVVTSSSRSGGILQLSHMRFIVWRFHVAQSSPMHRPAITVMRPVWPSFECTFFSVLTNSVCVIEICTCVFVKFSCRIIPSVAQYCPSELLIVTIGVLLLYGRLMSTCCSVYACSNVSWPPENFFTCYEYSLAYWNRASKVFARFSVIQRSTAGRLIQVHAASMQALSSCCCLPLHAIWECMEIIDYLFGTYVDVAEVREKT